MNTNVAKILRAVVGAVILVVLVLVVNSWWGEYRELSGSGQTADSETTATAEVSAPENGEAATETAGQPTEATKSVVVLIDGLNFREEPSAQANVIRGLAEGEKLVLIATKDGWYQVEDQKGIKGWISDKSSYTKME